MNEIKSVFVIADSGPAQGVSGIIKKVCKQLDWPYCHINDFSSAGSRLREIMKRIEHSDLILVDLTGLPSEVLYYSGVAHTLGNNVLTLFSGNAADLPDNLKNYDLISYEDTFDGVDTLEQKLLVATSTHAEWTTKPTNPVQDFLSSAPEAALIQDELAQTLREQHQQIKEDIDQRLSQLLQAVTARAVVDTSLLDQQIIDLRARLDDMLRKHNQAEEYLRRMARDRDVILAQVQVAALVLEDGCSAVVSESDDADLVFIPATLFLPGPPRPTEEERREAERFVRAFYMDRHPVTNRQFARFVEATGYETVAEWQNREDHCDEPTWRAPAGPGSSFKDRLSHPVIWVYREDAVAYARWAGRRLPTRLEWERAMRGVSEQTWPWGDAWDATRCNINSNSTTPVDSFPGGASPAGCMDMVGNVWEWTADELPGGKLLLMGGSWREKQMKTGYNRLIVPGDGTDGATGFRCAMDVPAE